MTYGSSRLTRGAVDVTLEASEAGQPLIRDHPYRRMQLTPLLLDIMKTLKIHVAENFQLHYFPHGSRKASYWQTVALTIRLWRDVGPHAGDGLTSCPTMPMPGPDMSARTGLLSSWERSREIYPRGGYSHTESLSRKPAVCPEEVDAKQHLS